MSDKYVNYNSLLEERHRLGLDEMSKISKVNAFNQFIDNLPTADVTEIRRGHWVIYYKNVFGYGYKCSLCGNLADEDNKGYHAILTNYCSKCGAKMDRGEKNE